MQWRSVKVKGWHLRSGGERSVTDLVFKLQIKNGEKKNKEKKIKKKKKERKRKREPSLSH
jgi:hypothetical protein